MSKYAKLSEHMGGAAFFNDKVKYGHVLKWYSDFSGAPLEERKVQANKIFRELRAAGFHYVQKVEVKNATNTAWRGDESNTIQDYDKICVFIDKI